MKILHVYDNERGEKVPPQYGGISFHVFFAAKHQAQMGHEVTILERKEVEDEPDEEYVAGIRVLRIKAKRYAAPPQEEVKKFLGPLRLIVDATVFGLKANKAIRREKPDIVHVHYPWAASVLVTVNRGLRRRMVYTAHIGEEKLVLRLGDSSGWPLQARLFSPHLYLMKRVSKVIILNEDLRSRLISSGKLSPEKSLVLNQGADIETFRPDTEVRDVKEKYDLKDKVTVLFVGVIIPRKGVWQLVKAMEEVVRAHPNVVLLLAGDFEVNREYAQEIAGLIDRNGLRDRARLLGHQTVWQLRKLYAACDIFVLPSFEEGFGLVVSEAMACGKPLVGSNVGGIPAQIRDGLNGFLVEPGKEDQLAEKLIRLVDDPDLRNEMGRNSRRLAEEEFNWSKVAEKLVLVYQQVADGRPG